MPVERLGDRFERRDSGGRARTVGAAIRGSRLAGET